MTDVRICSENERWSENSHTIRIILGVGVFHGVFVAGPVHVLRLVIRQRAGTAQRG